MLPNQSLPFTFETGRFYASFSSANARRDRNPELTLNLGVFFRKVAAGTSVPYNPGNAAAGTTTAVAWPNEFIWRRFKNIVINNSQRFWNGKFWLLPPASSWKLCQFLDDAPLPSNVADNRHHPTFAQPITNAAPLKHLYSYNVYCKANVYEATSAAHAHITFDVPYLSTGLHDDGQFINFANASGTGLGRFESGIVEPRALGGVAAIPHVAHHRHYQRQYIHEIGHALGQRHIGHDVDDTLCSEAPHATAGATHNHCYVGNNEGDESNIMGSGERLATLNCAPWRAVMARITGTSSSAWGAFMRRVYPRHVGSSQARPEPL